jgi:hypothetical protein
MHLLSASTIRHGTLNNRQLIGGSAPTAKDASERGQTSQSLCLKEAALLLPQPSEELCARTCAYWEGFADLIQEIAGRYDITSK